MERMLSRVREAGFVTFVATVAAGAIVLSSCGASDDYTNCLRPPVPVNVSAAITKRSVSLSPKMLGAGPIVLLVTNQSDASQVATLKAEDLESPGQANPEENAAKQPDGCPPDTAQRSGLRQTTGPINPADTAQLKVVVQRDTTYTLKTDDSKISPARLKVTRDRPSAQNVLLTP
jgi:hypothetical protein